MTRPKRALFPYWKSWFLFVIFPGFGFYFVSARFEKENTFIRPAFSHGTSPYFYIVKCPETPWRGDEKRHALHRLKQWHDAFEENGYVPLLLSDVISAPKDKGTFPEKGIVMVFEKGYRQTYRLFSPLLYGINWPVVWSTPYVTKKSRDTRYINHRDIKKMRKSGLWDIGFFNKSNRFVEFEGPHGIPLDAALIPPFTQGGTTVALNDWTKASDLHMFPLNFSMTAEEVVSRLNAEWPVRKKQFLFAKTVNDRIWGQSMDAGNITLSSATAFRLEPPLHKRSTFVTWNGTKWIANYDLEMKAENVKGDLWLHLSYNETGPHDLRVGLFEGHLAIQQVIQGRTVPLLSRADSRLSNSFHAFVSVRDKSVSVKVNGISFRSVSFVPVGSQDGRLGVSVSHPVRGTASVETLQLLFDPSPKDLL